MISCKYFYGKERILVTDQVKFSANFGAFFGVDLYGQCIPLSLEKTGANKTKLWISKLFYCFIENTIGNETF